jgi:hypothetical protein
MAGSEPGQTPEQQAQIAALSLGRAVLGREMTVEETEAVTTILKATVQALKHGFIRRLANHVLSEREDESVEEFFEDAIRPD